MSFWTWLDRNGIGVGVVVLVLIITFAPGGEGCRVRVGCGEVATGAQIDAGTDR